MWRQGRTPHTLGRALSQIFFRAGKSPRVPCLVLYMGKLRLREGKHLPLPYWLLHPRKDPQRKDRKRIWNLSSGDSGEVPSEEVDMGGQGPCESETPDLDGAGS